MSLLNIVLVKEKSLMVFNVFVYPKIGKRTIIKSSFEQSPSDFTQKLMKFQKRKTMLVYPKTKEINFSTNILKMFVFCHYRRRKNLGAFLNIIGVEF